MQLILTILVVIVALFTTTNCYDNLEDRKFIHGTFPDDFAWSSATSSYQIEGGWDADGKGVNIWDTFTGKPGNIKENATGKVACDSYHNYKEDVKLLKALRVKHYRFSLSWARLLPKGTPDDVNAKGVEYYTNLIDELLLNKITPQVTLYHWDLPQTLQDQGGFLNESMADWFKDYADFAFKTFGDKVNFWITFNEPWIICLLGYTNGAHAPGIKDKKGVNAYICGKNLLRSHAKAYKVYNESYRAASNSGKCGITLNVGYSRPNNTSIPSDVEAAERAMQFDLGWFAHPIFSNSGDYPQVMKDRVANRSEQQNVTNRLPALSAEDISDLKGSSDFFGLNFYSGGNTVDVPNKNAPWNSSYEPNYWDDKATGGGKHDASWTPSGSSWLFSTPELMKDVLVWIKNKYNNPAVYVTENGFSDRTGQITDVDRIDYYKFYINNVMQAIQEDKCNVKGYTAWSLMDNFEWAEGYVEKFGLHYVNFSDPKRPRVPKDSARYYTQIVSDNGFPEQQSTSSAEQSTSSTEQSTSSAALYGASLLPLIAAKWILI